MSARSCQAQMIACELTRLTGVTVEVAHDGQSRYLAQWTDGPTLDSMHGMALAQLSCGRYPDLQPGMITYARGHSIRAFAARACAVRRNGALANAIRRGVLERRRLATTSTPWARLSDAELAAHQYVESLLDQTAYPDRPDDPADEQGITALIQLSGGNEYAMLPFLLPPGTPADAAAR
jgi:hypothetical protein